MLKTSMYMPGANIADAQDFSDKLCFQYRKLSSSKLLIQQLNEQARIVGFLTYYALDNPRFVNEFARQLQRIMSSDLDDQSRNSVKIAGLQYLRHTSLFGKMDMSVKVIKSLLS